MKWFGRKAGRAAARPFLVRMWQGPMAVGEWPRSYEAQVREAYLGNPVAQRAVRVVAEGIGGVTVFDSPDAVGGRGAASTPLRAVPLPGKSRGGIR